MPKKTRRTRPHALKLQAESRLSTATRAQVVQPEAVPHVATPVAATSGGKRVDFSTEYHYIIGDLRKMALIAASMFIVLIALSFLIR